ncbi:MAG: putative hydro-lyase [Flaviflexus sp.]|nr:putative hydro-lyase [Flaviflexus sp.]
MGILTPKEARASFARGLDRPTAGMCPGFAQANLVALPERYAFDFLLFAQRNPKPMPLLDVVAPGETSPIAPGNLATELPRYRVFRSGELIEEVGDASEVWRDDLVTFLIGCSFTFEQALIEAGIDIAHISQCVNVPMFATSVPTRPAGIFSGPLVVSMRPIPASQVADAVRITSRYPSVHGAPVHVGDPEQIGIRDLSQPDYGEAVEIPEGTIPVFWACGVTPQAALAQAKADLVITHAPGRMLITDAPDHRYLIP